MCVASYCNGGFTASDHAKLKKLFLDAYGFKHLATLATLNDMGLFRLKNMQANNAEGLPNFAYIAQKLELWPKDGGPKQVGQDPSVAFSHSYIPIIHQVMNI